MSQTQVLQTYPLPDNEPLDNERIPATHPLSGLISINPARLSGALCFAGTRVPVKHLWDYLAAGEPLEEFLAGFPGVSREQAVDVLEFAYQRLSEDSAAR